SLRFDLEENVMNPNNSQGPPPMGPNPMGPPLGGHFSPFPQNPPNLHMPALDLQTMAEQCQLMMNGQVVTQIDTFYNGLTLRHRDTINAAARGTLMKRIPEECYDLIENMTAHHND
nr:reverse transcriptase domain-containing protein [Tanacetum cinerariifolium]